MHGRVSVAKYQLFQFVHSRQVQKNEPNKTSFKFILKYFIFLPILLHPTYLSIRNDIAIRMMRGDFKWPPEQTRQQMLEEVEEQQKIAEGPKFRPKKVHKVSTSSCCQDTRETNINIFEGERERSTA